MKLAVNALQSRGIDVRVDLGGRDVGMPKHFLNLAQIGSARSQMRGEAVPHRMRANGLGKSDPEGVFLNELPNRLPPKATRPP